ncbi:MAG: response regulator, partial [Candidatus Nitrosopolaris sp.]
DIAKSAPVSISLILSSESYGCGLGIVDVKKDSVTKIHDILKYHNTHKVCEMGQRHDNFDIQATKRILFVNDDTDTTAVIKTGLTRHGFEADAFVDPKLALQNFKADMYDLLLLDVMLKGTDGFEALR